VLMSFSTNNTLLFIASESRRSTEDVDGARSRAIKESPKRVNVNQCFFALLLALSAAAPFALRAQPPSKPARPLVAERPFVREDVLVERDFPLLSSLLADEPVRELLMRDPVLKASTAARWQGVAQANQVCSNDVQCKSASLKFTSHQIEEVSAALKQQYETNASVRLFAHVKLRPIAVFRREASLSNESPSGAPISDESTLIDAWVRSADALNQIIATYADGVPPHYAAIDAMTDPEDPKSFSLLVTILLDGLPLEESSSPKQRPQDQTLFFEPSLRFAMRLLEANARDEAGRLWPLKEGENADALKRLQSIDWTGYSDSVIVIPGEGPDTSEVALSPRGRERVRLGVAAFQAGKAAFILVTGGYVHPSQTPFCEALEMKRYLMQVYDIPAAAILLEPYARHTTTNLRNAAREVFTDGLPTDKAMLIVSDKAQLDYIQTEVFLKRNRDELGYLPVTLGKRLSATQLEAIPSGQSLYRDATDPLDP